MYTSERFVEIMQETADHITVAPGQEALQPLANSLRDNIQEKVDRLTDAGHEVAVLDADWSRANPSVAGKMHADLIIETYGSTYALPNKDPAANTAAINSGNLDVYFLVLDDKTVGTTCLVNEGNGRAELGRSVSLGNVGNSIIQDLRILDWLTDPASASKYHTLFTTLRSAPDRDIDDSTGTFIMRGGQGVTRHWSQFPGLVVSGFGPLYLKHGMLEQFTMANITRLEIAQPAELFLSTSDAAAFVSAFHDFYRLQSPARRVGDFNAAQAQVKFEAHYPPEGSGVTKLVHADIVADDSGKVLEECLSEVGRVESPFVQFSVPIDINTCGIQEELTKSGYVLFGYQPGLVGDGSQPTLLFGKVGPGVDGVVPTFWDSEGSTNPFWTDTTLDKIAKDVALKWQHQN